MIKDFFAGFAGFVVVGAMLFVVLTFIGAMIEGIGDWQVEHERCLKHAPNAYEARRCR